jgi:hypothetical protein
MEAELKRQFHVAVRITDTVEAGDVLTNVVEACGESPDEVDPFPRNNTYALPVTITTARRSVYLPLVLRSD